MPVLLITSPAPLVGKTTLAVGLAQQLERRGQRVALLRLAGDEGAPCDAALFSTLPFNPQQHQQPASLQEAVAAAPGDALVLVEAASGDPAEALAALRARAVAVLRYPQAAQEGPAAFCHAMGDALVGVAYTAVPRRRLAEARHSLAEAGLSALAILPEDRALASPTVAAVAEALAASPLFLTHQRRQVLERILISSLGADPGQGYFALACPSAVIVRSDKPDLQLAALNAGVRCLILTGGLQPLSYVHQRAEEEEILLLITQHDTRTAVAILEELYAHTPFAGQDKIQRIAQLLEEALDPAVLAGLVK